MSTNRGKEPNQSRQHSSCRKGVCQEVVRHTCSVTDVERQWALSSAALLQDSRTCSSNIDIIAVLQLNANITMFFWESLLDSSTGFGDLNLPKGREPAKTNTFVSLKEGVSLKWLNNSSSYNIFGRSTWKSISWIVPEMGIHLYTERSMC